MLLHRPLLLAYPIHLRMLSMHAPPLAPHASSTTCMWGACAARTCIRQVLAALPSAYHSMHWCSHGPGAPPRLSLQPPHTT
jgi:hypothetical protein